MGFLRFVYSLNFTNLLKDVIFYSKQLKFMVPPHSKGVLKLWVFFAARVVLRFLPHTFRGVEFFSLHPDSKSPTPPLVINDHSLNYQ